MNQKVKIEVESGEITEPLKVGVLKPYYYRTDDSGHDYFVPAEEIKAFDNWLELDTDSDEFYEHPGYDEYSLGGSFYDIKLFINPEDL